MTAMREPMGLKIYRVASRAVEPVANMALKRRLRAGKESPERIGERRGIASLPRPDGKLIWIHGASVGESLSILPLVDSLKLHMADARFLATTGTTTSAALMAQRLPDGAIHQFVPLDHPDFVDAFLSHWRPDAALFVESEFWPNLILRTRKKTSFMALINGRMSPESFRDWQSQPNAIRYILSSFHMLLGQDRQNAERLKTLSGKDVGTFGNLKNAATPLPADPEELARLQSQFDNRPRWLAASTHPGEEEIVIAAHRQLAEEFPDLLTVIAPRHPKRGEEIAVLAETAGLKSVLRSKGDAVSEHTNLYLADTLGELGLFYRLSDIAFIGGSITPKGGHNPLEPARLGASILHGPETFNFVETYDGMRRAGGAALVRNDRELASAIRRLFKDTITRSAMADAARTTAEQNAEFTLREITQKLLQQMSEQRTRDD